MQVGNKVVCIDDVFSEEIQALYYQLPKLDEVYTVRAVFPGRGPVKGLAEIGILLVELSNPADPAIKKFAAGLELGFNSERFRIVDESVKVEIHHGKIEA